MNRGFGVCEFLGRRRFHTLLEPHLPGTPDGAQNSVMSGKLYLMSGCEILFSFSFVSLLLIVRQGGSSASKSYIFLTGQCIALKYKEAKYEVLRIFFYIPLLLNSLELAVVQLRVLHSISSLWVAKARQQWRWHKVQLQLF